MQKLICIGFGFCVLALGAATGAVAGETIYAKGARFQIPFDYKAGEMQRLEAVEIQLHVSEDQGDNWGKALSVSPQTGRFDFQAPHDGEYWFSVKTLNKRQQLIPPASATTPEMKVVVDTTAPQLNLKLVQPQTGRVNLSWIAKDLNLNEETLKLEYQQAGSGGWQTVSVLPLEEGETAWTVTQGGLVTVRGTIKDLAGNSVTQQAQLNIDRQEFGNAPRIEGPDFSKPIANGNPFGRNVSLSKNLSDEEEPALSIPTPFSEASESEPTSEIATPEYSTTPPFSAESVPAQTVPSNVRVVNSHRFQIKYKVDDVGPSGIGRVEFFITENKGGKWFRYGEDPDHTSPFTVQVPRDGEYGFDLRVRSGAGLSAKAPSAGDSPAINIIVDQTPPTIQLHAPEQGHNGVLNQILIKWDIQELHPDEKPVALSYATTPQGPWQPIGGWQENLGSYLWQVNQNLPSKLYVRITARDAAGNMSTAQSKKPILIDLTKPTARIVNVESLPMGRAPANNQAYPTINNQ